MKIVLTQPDAQRRQVAATALAARGHALTVCRTRAEAEAAIAQELPALVIVASSLVEDMGAWCRGPHALVVWGDDERQLARLIARGASDAWVGRLDAEQLALRLAILEARLFERGRQLRRCRALELSRARYRALVQNTLDILAVLDETGRLRYVSPAIRRVLGYEPHAVLKRPIYELVHPDDRASVKIAVGHSLVPGITTRVEFRALHARGDFRYLEAVADNLVDYPLLTGIVLNARDVTDRHDLEQMLSHQAFYDTLTGLPNRVLFMDRVEHALVQQSRREGALALLFIDLDGFKSINDNFGHEVGDAALVAVAQRIEGMKREADTAARLGGDEFTLLLESIEDRTAAARVAARVVDTFAKPLRVGDFELTLTVSVGLAYSEARIAARELVRRADTAMYHAKKLGKHRYVEWEPAHDSLMPRSKTPLPGSLDLAALGLAEPED